MSSEQLYEMIQRTNEQLKSKLTPEEIMLTAHREKLN